MISVRYNIFGNLVHNPEPTYGKNGYKPVVKKPHPFPIKYVTIYYYNIFLN